MSDYGRLKEGEVIPQPPLSSVKEHCLHKLEEVRHEAERLNLDVVFADDFTLLLDLDSEEAYKLFLERRSQLKDDCGLSAHYTVTTSKSGLPRRHVCVRFKEPMDLWKRIALQFALGSDPVREYCHVKEALLGIDNSICLYEVKK